MAGPSSSPTSAAADDAASAVKPAPRYSVRALERGLCLLSALAVRKEASLGELAGDCELSKPSAFRLLVTMIRMRFVEQDPKSKRYRLGVRTVELANGFVLGHEVTMAAAPHMTALASQLGDSVGLAVIDLADVVVVSRVSASGEEIESASLRLPASSGAVAAGAILAQSAQRQQDAAMAAANSGGSEAALRSAMSRASEVGHSIGEGSGELSVAAAAPIMGRSGAPVGALVVFNETARRTRSQVEKDVIPVLRNRARTFSAELGYDGTYPGD